MQVRVRNGRIEILKSFRDENLGRSNQKIVGTLPLEDPYADVNPLAMDLPTSLSPAEAAEVMEKVRAVREKCQAATAKDVFESAPLNVMRIIRLLDSIPPKESPSSLSVQVLYERIDELAEKLSTRGLSREKVFPPASSYITAYESRAAVEKMAAAHAMVVDERDRKITRLEDELKRRQKEQKETWEAQEQKITKLLAKIQELEKKVAKG